MSRYKKGQPFSETVMDMTVRRFLTLRELSKGDAKISDLAKSANITPAGMTGTIDTMESHGIVERKDGVDRRHVVISITKFGRKVMKGVEFIIDGTRGDP